MHCSPGLSCIDHVTDHVLIMFGWKPQQISERKRACTDHGNVLSLDVQLVSDREQYGILCYRNPGGCLTPEANLVDLEERSLEGMFSFCL